jgi:hypothetical protein
MATILCLSCHWGNGPIETAGSVLVKSGLVNCQVSLLDAKDLIENTGDLR